MLRQRTEVGALGVNGASVPLAVDAESELELGRAQIRLHGMGATTALVITRRRTIVTQEVLTVEVASIRRLVQQMEIAETPVKVVGHLTAAGGRGQRGQGAGSIADSTGEMRD